MTDEQTSKRELLKKAAYIAPAILTLKAVPSFASNGSGLTEQAREKDQREGQQRRRQRHRSPAAWKPKGQRWSGNKPRQPWKQAEKQLALSFPKLFSLNEEAMWIISSALALVFLIVWMKRPRRTNAEKFGESYMRCIGESSRRRRRSRW